MSRREMGKPSFIFVYRYNLCALSVVICGALLWYWADLPSSFAETLPKLYLECEPLKPSDSNPRGLTAKQVQENWSTNFEQTCPKITVNTTTSTQTYRISKLLGRGNFGVVHEFKSKCDSVAVKLKNIQSLNAPDAYFWFSHDLETMVALSKCGHNDYVINSYLESYCCGIPCLVLDMVDGDTIAQFLFNQKGKIDFELIMKLLKQELDALIFLENCGICAPDRHVDNILVTRNGNNIVMIDFGKANLVGESSVELDFSQPVFNAVNWVTNSLMIEEKFRVMFHKWVTEIAAKQTKPIAAKRALKLLHEMVK